MLLALAVIYANVSAIDVLTYNYDTLCTGANTSETILNQSNVVPAQFGKLYVRNVDGIMYAQPLYASSISIGGGTHNVVYVATMHNSVYAFDADNSNQAAYWTQSMNNGAETTIPSSDVAGGDHNMYPEIGIVSTPVIDKTTNTIYLVAMTKLASPLTYTHRLHALDLSTGAEKFGGPVQIAATYPYSGGVRTFVSKSQGQRPALLEANGSIYFSFASFSDVSTPYWGWVMRYNAATLAQQAVFNANPETSGLGAGIWESGCGASADASGNIFLTTGNANGTTG